MTIEKLPSGSYRIRMQVDGKRYTVTSGKKPSQSEAKKLIYAKVNEKKVVVPKMTLKVAFDRYISSKDNILSPATIRGYKSIKKNIPDKYMNMNLDEIDAVVIQELINEYSKERSAKSVHNAHGLLCAVLGMFYPSLDLHTALPRKQSKKAYMPSTDEVMRLLEYSKDSEYYVALCLACSSCRRSEYSALTLDDIHYDKENHAFISINKALVPNEHNEYVIKDMPKTDASIRDIPLSDELLKRILEQGYIYRYNINAVDKYLRTTLPKLGINTFSVHALRHFYASYMHHLGYSDASIQNGGGWAKGSTVMQKIYIEELESEKTRQKMKDDLSKLF